MNHCIPTVTNKPVRTALYQAALGTLASGLLVVSSAALSGTYIDSETRNTGTVKAVHAGEKKLVGWSVAFDNDILVPSSRDQDYTYGMSATLAGTAARDSIVSLHQPLSRLNHWFNGDLKYSKQARHSIEAGLYGFTPEDISRKDRNHDDRPFASLLYLSSSKQQPGITENTSWRSTLTVGVLGLDVVGDLQNEVHRATNSDIAQGWDNQISDGGELTARYSIARQRRWDIGNPNVEIKTTVQGSAGYLTEASWGVSMRVGHLTTPWQSFNPELSTYRENATEISGQNSGDGSYFLAGLALKARAYNAFLQGQFRNSDVSYHSDELNHGIVEAWLGYSHSFAGGYRASYILRGHSSEVKSGAGDRNVIWGGLMLSQSF